MTTQYGLLEIPNGDSIYTVINIETRPALEHVLPEHQHLLVPQPVVLDSDGQPLPIATITGITYNYHLPTQYQNKIFTTATVLIDDEEYTLTNLVFRTSNSWEADSIDRKSVV